MTGDKKLDQDEVDALLNADVQGDEESEQEPASECRIEEYDFLQPSLYKRPELERLRQTSAQLPKLALHSLSSLMGCRLQMQLTSANQTQWQYVVEEVGETAVGYVFAFQPWGHRGIVAADRKFAASCVEWLMGNSGSGAPQTTLTELEGRVFSHVMQRVYQPLPQIWRCLGDYRVEGVEYVTEVAAKAPFSPVEELFQISLLVEGAFGAGNIMLAVPFEIVRKVLQALDDDSQRPPVQEGTRAAVKSRLQEVPLEVAVELGSASILAEDLLELDQGDIIMLDRPCMAPLDVRINGQPKMQGHPALSRGRMAVKIQR